LQNCGVSPVSSRKRVKRLLPRNEIMEFWKTRPGVLRNPDLYAADTGLSPICSSLWGLL
jgi:hypothetical protein